MARILTGFRRKVIPRRRPDHRARQQEAMASPPSSQRRDSGAHITNPQPPSDPSTEDLPPIPPSPFLRDGDEFDENTGWENESQSSELPPAPPAHAARPTTVPHAAQPRGGLDVERPLATGAERMFERLESRDADHTTAIRVEDAERYSQDAESEWEDEAEAEDRVNKVMEEMRLKEERRHRRRLERRTSGGGKKAMLKSKSNEEPVSTRLVLRGKAEDDEGSGPGNVGNRSLSKKRGVQLQPVAAPPATPPKDTGEEMTDRPAIAAYASKYEHVQWGVHDVAGEKVWPKLPPPTPDLQRIGEHLDHMSRWSGSYDQPRRVLPDGSGAPNFVDAKLRRMVRPNEEKLRREAADIERHFGPGSAWVERSPIGTPVVLTRFGQELGDVMMEIEKIRQMMK